MTAKETKGLLCTQDWTKEQLNEVLDLSYKIKCNAALYSTVLRDKAALLLFYNPSLRTHLSFQKAILDMSGNAIYKEMANTWSKNKYYEGESIQDIANVVSRYFDLIGIRITLEQIKNHGDGHKLLQEFQHYSTVPIINLAVSTLRKGALLRYCGH